MGKERDIWIELQNLDPGTYIIYVAFDWPKESFHSDFCVSSYG